MDVPGLAGWSGTASAANRERVNGPGWLLVGFEVLRAFHCRADRETRRSF